MCHKGGLPSLREGRQHLASARSDVLGRAGSPMKGNNQTSAFLREYT